MERHGKITLLGSLAVLLIALSACQQAGSDEITEIVATPEDITQKPDVGMANPAAVYCEGLGYSYKSIETAAGTDADCIFPDESRCGQWDFLSGRCGQEFTYCHQQGWVMMEMGTNIGVCVFDDGSTCDEYSYFQDECQKGDNPSVVEEPSEGTQESLHTLESTGIKVIGWMGFIVSTPDGAQFDDYIVVLPEGEVGEFGIEGINQEVSDQIIALRDHEQPGKYAHFWGKLTCDVIDYGGCQLLVERLRVDSPGEFFEPDPVDGWRGVIEGFTDDEPGAPQPDDAFIPTGEYPVKYGIDSAVSSESGERDLNEVITSLRDTGQEVVIWGEVNCGVPDAGGCRIEIYRLEAGEEIYELTPMK